MIFRICLTTLFLSIILSALATEEAHSGAYNLKAQDKGTDCHNAVGCPAWPHRAPLRCQDHRDCRKHESCHDFFKICFLTQTERSRMKLKSTKSKRPTSCKSNKDCRQNQTCHPFLATCIKIPSIQTTVAAETSASNTRVCKVNSDCSEGQYCHVFFNMCLPNLTVHFASTNSPPSVGCNTVSDCKRGEFCHKLTSSCLPVPTAIQIKTTAKSSFSCSSDIDCKITEFCHFLTGDQHRHQTRGVQDKEHRSAVGVCINKALKEVPQDQDPVFANCSQSKECGMGKCCLNELGLCAGYRLLGQLCVAEAVPFSCPCLSGLTCVSRRRPMRLRRLEKKLKLPKASTKTLNLQFNKSTEYRVGKCLMEAD